MANANALILKLVNCSHQFLEYNKTIKKMLLFKVNIFETIFSLS